MGCGYQNETRPFKRQAICLGSCARVQQQMALAKPMAPNQRRNRRKTIGTSLGHSAGRRASEHGLYSGLCVLRPQESSPRGQKGTKEFRQMFPMKKKSSIVVVVPPPRPPALYHLSQLLICQAPAREVNQARKYKGFSSAHRLQARQCQCSKPNCKPQKDSLSVQESPFHLGISEEPCWIHPTRKDHLLPGSHIK